MGRAFLPIWSLSYCPQRTIRSTLTLETRIRVLKYWTPRKCDPDDEPLHIVRLVWSILTFNSTKLVILNLGTCRVVITLVFIGKRLKMPIKGSKGLSR